MKKVTFFVLVLSLFALPSFSQSAKGSNLKSVSQKAAFPFVHPKITAKGILFGALHVVGVVTDSAERITATIAKGAAKVDAVVDSAEVSANPSN